MTKRVHNTYLVSYPDGSAISVVGNETEARTRAVNILQGAPGHEQIQVFLADFDKLSLTLIVTYRRREVEGPLLIELV